MTKTELAEIIQNGTEPDLVEDDDRFTVRLWRERAGTARTVRRRTRRSGRR